MNQALYAHMNKKKKKELETKKKKKTYPMGREGKNLVIPNQ
jgi:hypothetical protein